MSEIDDLMDIDPLELSEQQLDAIIAYHRNQRANWSDDKPKKAKAPAQKVTIDIATLFPGLNKAKPVIPPKGGIRRI